MPTAPQSQLDDGYKKLTINDFSAGTVSYLGQLALPLNAAAMIQNAVPFPGRLKYRGGFEQWSVLDDTADHAIAFYDNDGDRHFVVWRDGDMVDVVTGAEVVVDAASYTAGDKVGAVVLNNGILYWSTIGVPLRFWDPTGPSFGAVVQTGPQDMTGSPYLFVYTNAIVALGVTYDAAAYQPTVMGWSNVNDPTFWDASNAQAVGPLNEATLEFGIVWGIANTGVPPTRTFIVGRSDGAGIFSYTGALGALEENVINCPVGCRDGASAQFVPGADNFGQVIFLGQDFQFWGINGINAAIISMQIFNLAEAQVNAVALTGTRFWSGYNVKWGYYFCNAGDIQFVYKWDIKAWSTFTGVPNGPFVISTDDDGLLAMFIASSDVANLGFWRIALAGRRDRITAANPDGVPPTIKYVSAFLHAGDPELVKIWAWLSLWAYATGTRYRLIVRGLIRANDGTYMESTELIFNTASLSQEQQFILDVSLLDGTDVLAGAGSLSGAASPTVMHGRLACEFTPEPDSILVGLTGFMETLKSGAVQIQVEHYAGVFDFDILGLQLRYLERGYRSEGGNEYDSEMGEADTFDPFVPPLLPIDTAAE